jgi:hypothetical protein
LRGPLRELVRIRGRERHGVEAALGVDERRLDPRKIDDDVAVARLEILRHRSDLQIALAEVACDVVVGVDAGESQPRAIGVVTLTGLDEHVDLRQGEDEEASLLVATEHRESEGSDRNCDVERLRARGERELQRSGISAWLDVDLLLLC